MAKKKKIDWLNHSLEFIVVIIGILIAFQLNECSTQARQDKTIDTHLSQIHNETNLNKGSFKRAILTAENNLKKIDTVFGLIATKQDLPAINRLSLELLNLGGIYIRKNAYTSLIESGDIRHIRDFNVKQKVINLYEYYTWVEAFNTTSQNNYNEDFYPYVKKNFDLVNASLQDEDVYFSKEYLNVLATYRFTLNLKLQKYKDCLQEIEKYLAVKD